MTAPMIHEPACPQDRQESFDVDGPHDAAFRITRCLECGGQNTVPIRQPARLVPGTPEYERAWRLEPNRILAQLTLDQRDDPLLNPYHRDARALAPSQQPTSIAEAQHRRLYKDRAL